MIYAEAEELENMINQMRKSLILIAKETGLNSNDTLCYSQKLDKLITEYQKLQKIPTRKV
ncbi:aspartyl-phosphate phosphatase Spo0E family protein [Bacillus salipaludis]|uniref:Spo0E family sporulation regulatory protein-aspartic acid phosphatase n=1 Tax=Bacillus salipaludis TaxID=2547811 RepID=UPI003D25E590